MHYPIPERPTVRSLAAHNGTRDAHELGAYLIGRQSHLRVTVPSKIDELEVRSVIRIRKRACTLQVEALCVLETRTDAVLQQHVVSPIRRRGWLVRKKKRSQRRVLRKRVL